MKELKFRNFIYMEGKPVLFNELDVKMKQEVSEEISKKFYNAAGLDVTLDIDKEE